MRQFLRYLLSVACFCLLFARSVVANELEEDNFCNSYQAGDSTKLAFIDENLDDKLKIGVKLANKQTMRLVDKLQGYRGENLFNSTIRDKDFSFDQIGQEFIMEYIQTLIPLGSPGIAFFAIGLIICPYFVVARCCCAKKCCKPKKEMDEYSKIEVSTPICIYLIFTIFSCFFAFLGVAKIGGVVDGVVGGVCEVEGLLGDTVGLIDEVKQPINDIGLGLNDIDVAATGLFTQMNALNDTISDLIGSLENFKQHVKSLPDDSVTDLTTTLQDVISNLKNNVTGTVNATKYEHVLNNVLHAAEEQLSSIQGSMTDTLDGISDTISSSGSEALDPIKSIVDMALGYVANAAYGFYTIVFFAFVAGIFVVCTYVTPTSVDDHLGRGCLNCSWFLTYLFMLLVFLLFAIYFPLSIIFSDVCAVMYEVPQDFKFYMDVFTGDDGTADNGGSDEMFNIDPAKLLTGCFAENPVPLLTALNISVPIPSGASDITDLVNSSKYIDPILLELSGFSEFESIVTSMSLADFGLNETVVNETLDFFNNVTSTFGSSVLYTEETCTASNTCDKTCVETTTCAPDSDFSHNPLPQELIDAREGIIEFFEVKGNATSLLETLRSSVENVTSSADRVVEEVTYLGDEMDTVRLEVEEFLATLAGIKDYGDCAFLADRYYLIHENLCDSALGNLFVVSLYNLFIGLFAIPIICSSVCVNIRMFGVGADTSSATVWADTF